MKIKRKDKISYLKKMKQFQLKYFKVKVSQVTLKWVKVVK